MVWETDVSEEVQTGSGIDDSEGAQHALDNVAKCGMNLPVTVTLEQHAVSVHSFLWTCDGEVRSRMTGEYFFLGRDLVRGRVRGVTFLKGPGGIWHVGGGLCR